MAGWRAKRQTIWAPRQIVVPVSTGPSKTTYRVQKLSGLEDEEESVIKPIGFTPNYGRARSYDNDDDGEYGSNVSYYNSWKAGQKKEKKKFAWQPKVWSSYNFTSSIFNEDDNSNLFVKEPEGYLTPSADQIRSRVNVYFQPNIDRIKELCRVCFLKMVDDKDYIAKKYKDKSNMPLAREDYDRKRAAYDNIFDTYIPGYTPMEQAIHVHYKLVDQESRASSKTGGRGGGHFTFRREDYEDPHINSQLNHSRNKGWKLDILNKISLIGDLGKQFKVEKETGEKEVANSPQVRKKIMRDYSQFNQIDIYQKMLPNFRSKFLTKDLVITVPVQTSEKKQVLIVLVDFSGSMDETRKQKWVNAFLVERFRWVCKGEAEIYFSFFVHSPHDLHFVHVKDAKDVENFWNTFSNDPNGSMTDIGRIVKYVSNEIDKGKLHNLDVDLSKQKPEILIINDGQDEVGFSSFPYKVNAISLCEFSTELKDLCVASGGKQVRVYSSNKIDTYSSEGVITLVE